jgi:hypothetical protein
MGGHRVRGLLPIRGKGCSATIQFRCETGSSKRSPWRLDQQFPQVAEFSSDLAAESGLLDEWIAGKDVHAFDPGACWPAARAPPQPPFRHQYR